MVGARVAFAAWAVPPTWGVGNLFAYFLKISGAVQPFENLHRAVAVAAAVHSWCPTPAAQAPQQCPLSWWPLRLCMLTENTVWAYLYHIFLLIFV